MDTPVAAAPWLVLGAVLGILLVAAVGLAGVWLLRRNAPRSDPSAPPAPAAQQDDLPGFLESPPGSGDTPPPPTAGWATLAPPPPAPVRAPAPEPAAPHRSGTLAVLLAALALVLLVGAAAVLALVSRSEDGSAPAAGARTAATDPDDVAAELGFGGLVLERRTVGVTATYPRVLLTTERGHVTAEVELPTYNCLTAEAPDDPAAAGCVPAGTEHAELASPELTVTTGEDGEVRIAGRFPTRVHPNGSAPAPTGRSYALEMTVEPTGEVRRGEWLPATGTLRLGNDRTVTSGGADDRLRLG